jgi:hemoglobin
MGASLYERIGGENAVMAAVDIFYDKVIADQRTARFFNGLDVAAQSRKQVAFMTWAFGGPSAYKGRPLREAHADLVNKMGLSDEHFDAVAEHLVATLQELGVAKTLIDEAVGIVATTRNEVLGR